LYNSGQDERLKKCCQAKKRGRGDDEKDGDYDPSIKKAKVSLGKKGGE
jgi:hypothetical protein